MIFITGGAGFIGVNAMVVAGAVVTKSVRDFAQVIGSRAQVIRYVRDGVE